MDDFMGSVQIFSNIQSHMFYFQLSQIYSLAAKRLGVLGRNVRSNRHRFDGDLPFLWPLVLAKSMLAPRLGIVRYKVGPKSVPGTRCGARSDASKKAAQIGARQPVGSHVPDERFPSARPMIDIATEILQSLQARNGKCIGTEEVAVIHPLPWDIRTNATGYSVIVDATGTEVLLAFGDDPKTSRAVAEFVVRSLLSYSRP